MKTVMLAITVAVFAAVTMPVARADSPTCTASATDKKLAGAAKTSFMTKCENDAKASCNAAATDKKLAGAAKTSFTTKCVKDAIGS